jgi:hypothetical protein
LSESLIQTSLQRMSENEVSVRQIIRAKQFTTTLLQRHEVKGQGNQVGVMELFLRIITVEEDNEYWIERCNKERNATISIDGGPTGVSAVCPDGFESKL